MTYKTQRFISTMLGLLGAAGTVATAVFAVKATPKAMKKIDELKKENNSEKISKKVLIKELFPIYLPSIIIGVATVSSTTISTVLSRRTEASLIATSMVLSQGWNKYKYKLESLLGPKAKELLRSKISIDDYKKSKSKLKATNKNKQLYWEEHLGWFYADPVELTAGISDANQRLYAPDPSKEGSFYFATLYLLSKDARLKVLDKEKLESCKHIGWTADYIYEAYEKKFVWIHPYYTKVFNKDTGELLYTRISFWEEPIFLIDSEINRDHYKSRKDYEHEAESDINFMDEEPDYAALDLYYKGRSNNITNKLDCNQIEDDLDRLISANPNIIQNYERRYDDGSDIDNKENVDNSLPAYITIPDSEENN